MVRVIGYDLAKKKFQELEDKINNKYNKTDTVGRAYRDGNGNSIAGTYLTKSEFNRNVKAIEMATPSVSDNSLYVSWSVINRDSVGSQGATLKFDGVWNPTISSSKRYIDYTYNLSNSEVLSGQYVKVVTSDFKIAHITCNITLKLSDGRSFSTTI